MRAVTSILMLCLEGNILCERDLSNPQLKYYEPGKACYIEGVFYQSCPKMEWMK
jgi:hypothetical protein